MAIGDYSNWTTANNGLSAISGDMIGINANATKNGGYYNTNGVTIANAQGEYTLELFVGDASNRPFRFSENNLIGFFLDGTTIDNPAGLQAAIDAFANDLDVTYTVGAPATAQATPVTGWEKWTYTFTVADNGGNVFGSDLQFGTRWQLNSTTGNGNFWIDNIPEPATFGLLAVVGGGLLFIRRLMM